VNQIPFAINSRHKCGFHRNLLLEVLRKDPDTDGKVSVLAEE
jgi:hypothetical protein